MIRTAATHARAWLREVGRHLRKDRVARGAIPLGDYADVFAAIDRARDRSPNWGDDLPRPSKDTIERALTVVELMGRMLIPPPDVVTPDGEIALEWRRVTRQGVFEIKACLGEEATLVSAGYAHVATFVIHDTTYSPNETVNKIRDCFDMGGL